MLREAERIFNANGKGIKKEVKMRHSQFLRHAKALHNLNGRLWDDYQNAYKDKWQKTDELRRIASYMARLMMLIADRCSDPADDWYVEDKIMRMVQELPEKGLVSQELVDEMKMR